MIITLKGKIIKNNNILFLNYMNSFVEAKYVNFEEVDNDQGAIYVKKYTYINEKQTIEDNLIVFHNFELLRMFTQIISLNGFGLKTTINIFNQGAREFFEMLSNGQYDEIKEKYNLNFKQMASLMKPKEKTTTKMSKKMQEVSNALENLGYKKTIIKKCLNSNLSLLEETNFSILLKKFVELIKNEL